MESNNTNQTPYTPGPWEDAGFGFIVGPDPAGIHPDIYIAELASEDDEGRVAPDGQLNANARLIAAAPELLSALKDLLQDLDRGIDPVESGTIAYCEKVIAKVKGGSPIDKAKALIPFWMLKIHDYDGLEIHPCHEQEEDDGSTHIEQCEAEEAQFWSVYGHLKTGGIECFEDHPTEKEARKAAEQILAAYPHLNTYGILG